MSDLTILNNQWTTALGEWMTAVANLAYGRGSQAAVDSAYVKLTTTEARYIEACRGAH
jgi:hypothetical protein